ncbi:putative threonine dehydratase [Porphyridium purpureum]|uniref:Putative threonine dehydratase n=1 Tax=Porphyridium purpureum TaxID=35688 RepID=A0A5J4Z633_PORPP|nr:putative threonine dehydratase [Porphyridium purpureum]|eukprot:POR2209..scf295_1
MTTAFAPWSLAYKAEHLQRTASFKLRGALNRLMCLSEAEKARGVVTASTGNHGIGVATAGQLLGVSVTVFVASRTDVDIVHRLQSLGASVQIIESTDCVDAERVARRAAADGAKTFVSPYNDPLVVSGQGTIAVELVQQLADVGWSLESTANNRLDAVVVAVGGGGLISGIATFLASVAPHVRVIAAQPAADDAMHASVNAAQIVDISQATRHTLSHSTAGGIEADALTFDICRNSSLIHQWILVGEEQIKYAVRTMLKVEHQIIEGAAGVAFAAGCQYLSSHPEARVLVISCGARLTPAELELVLES